MARRIASSDYMMISPGTDIPSVVNMIVEIPKGKRNKFELDKDTGLIKLDRYLYSSSVYPGDYGFIPQTLAEDGDPLDILVMVNEPTFSGCLIEARVVGHVPDEGQGGGRLQGARGAERGPAVRAHQEAGGRAAALPAARWNTSSARTSNSKGRTPSRSAGSARRRRRRRSATPWTGSGRRWATSDFSPASTNAFHYRKAAK